MPEQHLHIVSFDIPYPPVYGGVIDVYYKILALKKEGVKVTLHCFQYRKSPSEKLNELCEKVYYYKRKEGIRYFFSSLPYIVCTRSSQALLKNLQQDNHPILFEGLHSCYFLGNPALKNRKKIVRMHNIEQDYYQGLARVEKNIFKKTYFRSEAAKLKKFETVLSHAGAIAAISPADTKQLQQKFPAAAHLPPFHPFEKVEIAEGLGAYALYHGNLSVVENNEAALFLVKEVFSQLTVPFIIAGNTPSPVLKREIKKHGHIQIRPILSTEELYTLVRNAQINVLPAVQSSGIRLKMITALFTGRHCIVNREMAAGSGLEDVCIITENVEQMQKKIKELFTIPVDQQAMRDRKSTLEQRLSNSAATRQLVRMLTDQ